MRLTFLDLWARATYDFGLTEYQFSSLTLRHFAALSKRQEETIRLSHFHAGIVASTIANCHRDPQKTRPFRPQDFMPGEPPEVKTPEELSDIMRGYISRFGDN